MDAPILVTGGTGTLGRLVVPRLREAGHHVRILSRHPHDDAAGVEHVQGELMEGTGLDAAVDGVETVVHLAGSSNGDDVKAHHVARAAAQGGVRHLVHISVVGVDRVPLQSALDRAMFGYFGAKLDAERTIADSGVPWSMIRATQFHEAIVKAARLMARAPLVVVPSGFRFQPVAADEVAARLVDLAQGPPAGLVPDLAGPTVHGMDELVRGYLRAVGRRRPLVRMRVPGAAAQAFREGANLAPDRAVGHRTWDEFLVAPQAPAPAPARAPVG